MKTMAWSCGLGMILLGQVALAAPPPPDKVTLAPVQAVVLASNAQGENRVAFRFDLTGLRQGKGRHIEEAFLEWSLSGIPSGRMTEYAAYPVTAEWVTVANTGATSATPAIDPVAFWEISPADCAAGLGSLVRLDLQPLATTWADSSGSNFGVIVGTEDLSTQALGAQLGTATLVVRFGFSDTE